MKEEIKKKAVSTTKKRARKKKVSKKIKDEQATVIPKGDLYRIEQYESKIENAKLKMAVEEQNKQNNRLLLENGRLKLKELESQINRQTELIRQLSADYLTKENGYTEFKKEMWKRLGYKDTKGIGYNPETGDIINVV